MSFTRKHCLECNAELNGRNDKKFCSEYCRAHHHNKINAGLNNYVRKVNYAIRKNRSILHKLQSDGRKKAHKLSLMDAGLNFDYVTNVYSRRGKLHYFCYDQGYVELSNDYYALIVRDDYLD